MSPHQLIIFHLLASLGLPPYEALSPTCLDTVVLFLCLRKTSRGKLLDLCGERTLQKSYSEREEVLVPRVGALEDAKPAI